MVNKKKQLPGKCASDELYCYDNAIAIDGMEVTESKTSDLLSSTSSDKSSSVYVKMKPDSEKSRQRAQPVSFITLFRHSDLADKLLIFLGIIGAIIHGISSPFMVIIFGELADSFVRYSSCVEGGFSPTGKPQQRNFSNINCSHYYRRGENETNGSEDLTEQMAFFAIYYLICSAVVLVFGFLQVFTLSTTAARQSRKIRCLLFRSIAHQEREWIDNHEAHEINSKLDQDVSKISEVIGDKTGCFVQSASASLFGIVIGFYYQWRLTLVIMSAAPVLASATVLMGKFHGIWCEKEAKAYVKAGSIVESVLKNIRTVVAYGAEEQEVNRYDEKLIEAKSIGIKKGVMRGAFQGVIWCALILTFALAFWYGSGLVLNRQQGFTLGKLLTVFLSIMYAVSSLGHAASIADSIFSAKSAARGIFDVIDKDSKIDPSSEVGQLIPHVKGEISFDSVSFCYPVREKYAVLNGYCANFEAGKIYAITGPSGSGKSTVLKLIQRLYNPKRGKILLDNHDISTLKVRWLRSLIGVVRQEPTLFATTILENIKLGWDAATTDDVIEAAKAANAYDFIMNLPEKFDTLVGMQGCHLSGGQKQRIAIARALVRKPKILLLDQPCSALDTQSEAIVLDALQKSRLARTTIVVTHRPSTIRIADHVTEIKQDGCLGKSLRERKKSFRNSRIVKSVDACRMIEFMTKYNETADDSVFDSETTVEEASWMSACESEIGDGDDENDDVKEKNGTSCVSTNRILNMNRSEWPHFVIGSLAALVNGAVQPIFAMILSAVIGVHVLPDDSDKSRLINYYCSLMVGLGGFTFFAYLIQNSVFAFSGEILTRRLRRMTFAAILRQEMAFFDDHTKKSCSLPYLLAYHVSQVQGLSGVLIGIIVGTATTVVLTLVITLYSGWQLALLQFACFPIIIVSHAIDSKMHGNTVRDQKHMEEGGQIILETLNAHETVVHLGKEEHFVTRFENVLSSIARNKQKRSILQGLSHGIAHAVNYLTYAATFRLGAYLIETREITFENLFRVYFVIVFAAISIGRNIKHMPDFAKARKSASKIFRLIDRKSAIDAESTAGIHPISEFSGELQLKSCSFAYATRPNCLVLNNLDIAVEKGQTLALVGRSGCGKSTVIQMIERFYDPTVGSVCINGRDAKIYNVKYLRSKIGAAFQDPVLFEGTVFDNIAYGLINGPVTKAEVISAAQTANIHDAILRLDKGYETMLGPGGRGLSRGEKQRIAIARALIRDPAILLLDEATSCLDEANEEAVQKALKKAREGRTTVIVAHKLKTIQDADIIAVISGGNVVESGTHKELMEFQGSYYNMIQTGATLA